VTVATRGPGIDRRDFLRLVGGGIVILVGLGPEELLAQGGRRLYPEDLNAYLRIAPDGKVTVFVGKIEMGQGVMTSLAQMAAEDLGVALDAVEMVMGDTARCPWDMGTFGSLSTRMFGPVLRAAAAEARTVLIQRAAAKLGVDAARLELADGVVSVKGAPDRRVTYGELAQGKPIARLVGEKAVLRSAAEFRVMGRSPRRFDARDKVTGAAQYAADFRRPGMLHACLVRPPAHGATLTSLDTSAAEKLAGVSVVHEDDLIAVLHPDRESAEAALGKVLAEWTKPAAPFDTESVFEHLVAAGGSAKTVESKGDVGAARAAAAHAFHVAYHKGYVAHAPVEPHTALAELADGRLTVWASTQTPFPTRDDIAERLGMKAGDVRVITPYVGGGFGGKSAHQQALEAARLAVATRRPVQVAWTRAEEFFYDTFDPAAVVEISSALDADGRISLWDYQVWAAGERSAGLFYDVPNVAIRSYGGRMSGSEQRSAGALHLFGVGPWRAPGANMNVFARESQIDLMAAAAGADPLEFRLRNLSDQRMRKVLDAAASAYGWKGRAKKAGVGHGLACGEDAGSYVALMAEVRVDPKTGAIRVERVVCAQDMGIVVSPDGATMQVEGAITMGLGYTLAEELRFEGGRILDRNFDTYSLPRFSWVPKIETVLIDNPGLAPQGGGEPAIVPTGAVVANAVADALGVRFHRLPMTPERVLAAIAGKA
jgi:nicotinate dehydrogenase subunit B